MYKNYAIRQSKIMNKFLKQNESKRKWYKNNPPAELDFHSSLLKEKKPSVHAQRRMVVLNKLFMKNITDLMSTCEAASELSERGVEITNVSISSDYKSLNVYWTLEKVDDDKNWPTTIEEVLQKNSYMLRHELSQMHIISNVPIICFVKDKIISNAREVESRLASLDLDQDYIESKEKTKQLDITNDNETDQSDNSFQITLPEMRHDVLGLDHHRIMSKDVLESHSELKGQPLSAFLNNEDISKENHN
ncbi:PREDICTED: putative ribosome-binding factor A, mitochondrial [Polistes dominula]|uniref:Ribosome-binding factor A, mitochondrial n=1 Tax=Polistes dominula TaxID=743375 RepID=A0ABM1JBW2_POLDO|nr:PREDICTED: putative ribosome-binding factor A, mitochondrial [Polistes dominula]